MTLYEVQITNRALADMESIYSYIADVLQAPDNAMNQYNRIAKAIEGLGGPRTDKEHGNRAGTRQEYRTAEY